MRASCIGNLPTSFQFVFEISTLYRLGLQGRAGPILGYVYTGPAECLTDQIFGWPRVNATLDWFWLHFVVLEILRVVLEIWKWSTVSLSHAPYFADVFLIPALNINLEDFWKKVSA